VLERADAEAGESIADLLPALLTPVEAHGLRESKLPGFEALDAVRGRDTDATSSSAVSARCPPMTARARRTTTHQPELRTAAGTGHADPHARGPERPAARVAVRSVASRAADLSKEIGHPPRVFRPATPTEAEALIALAREAMATRSRDLDAFAYANAQDAWWIEDDGGLAFALIGMQRGAARSCRRSTAA